MDTPTNEKSPLKICISCGLEIHPGEGHATHGDKHWHYGTCVQPEPDPRKNLHPEDAVREDSTGLKMKQPTGRAILGMGYGPKEGIATAETVYSPPHYIQGHLETIYVIEQVLGEQGFKDFCIGNYIKYRERHAFKNGGEDLKKAEQYLEWATNGLPEPVNGRVPR